MFLVPTRPLPAPPVHSLTPSLTASAISASACRCRESSSVPPCLLDRKPRLKLRWHKFLCSPVSVFSFLLCDTNLPHALPSQPLVNFAFTFSSHSGGKLKRGEQPEMARGEYLLTTEVLRHSALPSFPHSLG